MKIVLINLERSADRLATFRKVNRHLTGLYVFKAADGQQISNDDFIRSGLVSAELLPKYTRGALGCALSHATLWQEAVATRTVITVAEDDAVLRNNFESEAEAAIGRLPQDWDVVFWGYNCGAHILHVPSGSAAQFDTIPLEPCRERLAVFQSTRPRIELDRLEQMLGLVCYSISPKGAERLMQLCLPLRPVDVQFAMLGRAVPNLGLDIAMNEHYRKLQAFVAIPPLALSPNELEKSTIQMAP